MSTAVIHDGMTFASEEALIAFMASEDEDPRTPGAARQKRFRDRERRADTYWEFRIRNNRMLPNLVSDISGEMIEQAKVRVADRLRAYVELFPERVTE